MDFYDVEGEFYDIFYLSFEDDLNLYRKFLCPRVLELFCGTGRLLMKLMPQYGVGVDINEGMLERARENLKGMNVRLVKADARNFHLGEKFCLIIIPINSLLMFPRGERIKILRSAAEHLDEGGRIIVDLLNPYEMVEDIVHHGDTVELNGIIYSRFFVPRWRRDHWEVLYFYDVVESGIVRRKHAKLPIYPVYPEDVEDEAKEAGLKVVAMYGDYEMGKYGENSERIIAVMERRV